MRSFEEAVTVSRVTNNIRVTVVPEFLEEHSDPGNATYSFSYTVTIENLGDDTVQLLNRHWHISSGGGDYMEERGEGVIGEQPVLKSYHGFRYTSGTVIKDPVGQMHGTYTFKDEQGNPFEVSIPCFDLLYPHLLH